MPRHKSRRKSKQSALEQIGPALLPVAALTAVPAFGAIPYAPTGRPLTLALNVFSTVTPSPSTNEALAGPSGEHGDGFADHQDDSFNEDEDIEEAGYSTVVQLQASRTSENRKSYSDRERVPTPPTLRNVATVEHVTPAGDVYHILEPDEADPVEPDLYAVPAKGKGTGKKTVETQEEDASLDRTQQDLRHAMQAVHDMPVEDTMKNLSENRQVLGSNLGSSSGRGTMWQDDDEEDSETEEPPPLPPPPVDFEPASEAARPQHASKAEASPVQVSTSSPEQVSEASPDRVSADSPDQVSAASSGWVSEAKASVKDVRTCRVEAAPKHETEVIEVVSLRVKQVAASPHSAGSGSGAVSPQLSATPRDAPSLPLEEETRQTDRKQPKGKKPSLRQDVADQGKRTAPVKSKGGSVSSARRSATPTPSDAAPYLSLQREVEQVKGENHTLHQEIDNLKKMVAAVTHTGEEGKKSVSVRQSPRVDELKNENEVLKNAVGRLNQELSQYQAAFRPLSEDDQSKLQSLPKKGPVPAWLINKRYLSPLFLAYDDLIQEKEEIIHRCQTQLQTLKQRTEEVVRENQRQQQRGNSGAAASMGVICASDWQSLQEQARLVLEENQILTEQVDLQHRKVKDLCSSHMHEAGRLTKRLTSCEQDREEMEHELEETRSKLKDVKQKHDRLQLEALKRTSMHDHVNTVAGLQREKDEQSIDSFPETDTWLESGSRSVAEEKEQFEKEKEAIVNRLMASDEERKRQSMAAIETAVENKRLKAELSALNSAVRRSQNKLLVLQKAIRQSESQELITQNELANVIQMVEKTVLERDTAVKAAREKHRDCTYTVNQIMDSSVVLGKMEEKLKMYKLKASAKIQTVSDRLKEQDDMFNRQRQEYEREICYLRSLLKEKEERIGQMKGEKKTAEEALETVWQAARSENQVLKETLVDSMHKLHQHPNLHTALEEEEDLEKLLYFSA